MKKIYATILSILVLGICFGGKSEVNASERNTLESGYYTIHPVNNPSLQVGTTDFTLINPDSEYQKFEFSYLSTKNAYYIGPQFAGMQTAAWNGVEGVGNLIWDHPDFVWDVPTPSKLWIIEKTDNGQFIIHNKKDESMVWDVNNYYANLGTKIKLEKLHDTSDVLRDAQTFILTKH
ncbi:hypothetical protein ACSFB8_11970 [Enterococcus faecalis]